MTWIHFGNTYAIGIKTRIIETEFRIDFLKSCKSFDNLQSYLDTWYYILKIYTSALHAMICCNIKVKNQINVPSFAACYVSSTDKICPMVACFFPSN